MSLADRFSRRVRAYKALFAGDGVMSPEEARDVVLADLMKFCRVTDPAFVRGDAHASAHLEGRREVALRILQALRLDWRALNEAAARAEQNQKDMSE